MALIGHRHTWNEDTIRYIGGAGYGHANIDVYKRFEGDGFPGLIDPYAGTLGIGTESEGFLMKQRVSFRIPNSDLFWGCRKPIRASVLPSILSHWISMIAT
ncbi:hypothetical protein JCM19239_6498 [Vibrio variabilis]|uniref:Outer membrane protein n=1 Tax=Vibrio variabilis TaxID=990271 RepID=A0ABQ0JJD3_9VIBR|nr:hypothetical protein JCM19239_6498 [Vibrio variabilis]